MKPEKVAVVTGAARGIGQAICEQLLEDGFHVVGLDISPLEWSQSAQLSSYQVNLCDAAAVSEVVDSIVEQHGRIDALVNNAGITRDALLPDMLEQDWDSVIDVNLKAVFLLTQRVAPVMLKQGAGSIVSISSIVGTDGNIGQSNYGASKGGVISMSKGWAKELSRKGAQIRVNCVAPGFITTDMTKNLPEKVIQMMESKTPLGRMGSVQDIANGVAFLVSDKSAFITGQLLKIDGGLVL
ncbi:TPA: beta-ketoacyl-ACP reductase [Vibrio parahaemolyticus]|uniref:beta-ketoacyl-ACP reductase n=1 Tax=Vibrio parahaemolyticus TaxID=670 RepID=UPI00038E1629|nr:beta-ketoacyl-ACP reductase [Vibrio parahaemolyticus]EGR1121200.1 beta-ketoacyl-ACP reductase [Vibrio parahaemolyticus]EQM16207.1 short chain dehydrogenase family protein [Vibrio parahaemolyticus 3259]ETJ98734.1 short chain dehydrogenase family protein [Vibrio parahaemolyticus EKP-008]HCH2420096.1 beta-ketoacyl-ACP reductase [Vibrio parahaemolyticus]